MDWNRRRNTLLNGLLGALLGLAIARWRDRDDTMRVALIAGGVFAVISWLGYEKPEVLQDENAQ
jgi:hypothetical protein